ncbi:PREDICTED: tensin-4 isoform X2 [Chinchilla lanigera]|uniref:tensin-4 isoform X2 n=1 Tax=Chinchilla lanigera TaxID=34839 RepID=UPI0006987E00|nr:PREDICTED: tensin-4 isoform X2 [Chinchilla lanigera]
MSWVMPGSLLAGGHTVPLAPCTEPKTTLHAAPSPSLPPLCPYYTTGGWGAQALMAPTPSKGPPGPVQRAPQPHAKASGTPQDLDSYIDFSLETLNQMILELDPTFQLLPPGTGAPPAGAAQSQDPGSKKQEPEAVDIKYIEVTSPRPRCREGPPRCSSPSVTPPTGSPCGGGLLCRDAPREARSSSDSLVFSGSQGGGPSPRPSPSIAIPGGGGRACGPHGLGSPVLASPGLEKGPKALTPQRGSRVSVLSASPTSEVSYVFGSQSLFRSSISSHQSSRSLESRASSSSSLHSLGPGSTCTKPGDVQAPSNPTPSVVQPGVTHSPPLATEHASSCPPSITNSMVDIPIVLINGCPEPQSPPPQQTPGHRGFVQAGAASPRHPCPATKSRSQTLPDTASAVAPEGPARDAQPTMKFVMDTSKYWFKPSITREQAIELLKKEEPGAFVIRDSSSYRGSFGLALKVQEAPASAQHRSGEDSSDLIRHFLIESSAKGVHLKGADEEPYFGSLSAFVCQHSIMALALPCPLAIPKRELGAADRAAERPTESPACLKKAAGCHTLYLRSVSMETLSGALAVQKAVSATLEQEVLPTPTVVHFRVTEQGITLTDVQRKVFFRRHYPLSTLRFCGTDPEQRKWQKYCKPSRIFGFVAKSQTEPPENICHLFAEYDAVQPASRVISLVTALLQEAERM